MVKQFIFMTSMFLLGVYSIHAQETLNANDPNSFIFGGDQKSNTLSVDILPVAIVDIEPDPGIVGGGGGFPGSLEAGLPATGGGGVPEGLWMNFTYRALNYQPARIYVSTNQPVPAKMTIYVEIISTGAGGDFPKNPRFGKIKLKEKEQVIVDDFANGYTGDGVNNGYELSYTIENPDGVSLPDGFEILYRIQ